MEKLIKEIEDLITNINADATRKKLSDLCIKLIELSHLYGDAKMFTIRSKAMLEMAMVEKKDDIKTQFEKIQDGLEEIKKENKTRKRAKLTVDELDTQVRLTQEIKDFMNAKLANEEISVRLEPLLKSYYEFITNIRFLDNQKPL